MRSSLVNPSAVLLTLAFLPMNAPAALAQDTAAEVVRRRGQERIAGKCESTLRRRARR